MQYIRHKDLLPSIRVLYKKGGPYQKAAKVVEGIIGRIANGDSDPFSGISLTKHGEGRIKKCKKYDLVKFCRLITVVDADYCHLLYAGSHNDCDVWIDRHRGFVPAVDSDQRLVGAVASADSLDSSTRLIGQSDHSHGKLYEKLREDEFDLLVDGLPRAITRRIENLESIDEEDEIIKIVDGIGELDRKSFIYDVFVLLRQGDIRSAKTRIGLFRGDIVRLKSEVNVKDGEHLRVIPTNSPHYAKLFEHFVRTADYRDWMTFMHPEQEKEAVEVFSGPTKLTGVSGSGKTCIVVRRAGILAERYQSDEILVLTLNRPLAALIDDLVSTTVSNSNVRERIRVVPFFALCQDLLGQFEPDNWKLYDDRTWKSQEHIDEVWREYYRCQLNNRDAECMQAVHDSLVSRSIDAEQYIREEFDWIRSAVPFRDREKYLEVNRSGRSYALDKRFRALLLQGLDGWEKKMRDVGVTDYLGIATALYRYRDELRPRYRCILIDECQDFGTIELELIKKLVVEGPDDLFLCGDAAQQVSWKHQSLNEAEIPIPRTRSRLIRRNYRNSRDVLQAAHEILVDNLTDEMVDEGEFEILDPEFSNFSGSAPLRLEARSLAEEIAFSVAYAKSEIEEKVNYKVCVAICGYSLYEIQRFGESIDMPVLDGTRSILDGSLFLSDLEQTKGFEFDLVCIVNTSDGVIPNATRPEKEQWRDLSKLYVAMTRAKLQLILSYSRSPSCYISKAEEHLLFGKWAEYISCNEMSEIGIPKSLEYHKDNVEVVPLTSMAAEEFLYTKEALGSSARLIPKLRELVTGMPRFRERIPVSWRNLAEAARDVRQYPGSRQQFGPEVVKEFEELVERLVGIPDRNPD